MDLIALTCKEPDRSCYFKPIIVYWIRTYIFAAVELPQPRQVRCLYYSLKPTNVKELKPYTSKSTFMFKFLFFNHLLLLWMKKKDLNIPVSFGKSSSAKKEGFYFCWSASCPSFIFSLIPTKMLLQFGLSFGFLNAFKGTHTHSIFLVSFFFGSRVCSVKVCCWSTWAIPIHSLVCVSLSLLFFYLLFLAFVSFTLFFVCWSPNLSLSFFFSFCVPLLYISVCFSSQTGQKGSQSSSFCPKVCLSSDFMGWTFLVSLFDLFCVFFIFFYFLSCSFDVSSFSFNFHIEKIKAVRWRNSMLVIFVSEVTMYLVID